MAQPASSVSLVAIYNRYDCCQDRLSPFQIWVGESPGDFNSATARRCGVQNQIVPDEYGPFAFNCHGITGWYVTIVLPGDNRQLNLAEVYIFAPPSPPPPPMLPAPAGTYYRCENTCAVPIEYNKCDDGGPGSFRSWCVLGTDCGQCGPRMMPMAPSSPPQSFGSPGCQLE